MKTFETLLLREDEEVEGVFILTLNRPDSMNALNTHMAVDLVDCLTGLHESKNMKVLVLTAAGERSFCVGADLKERDDMTNEQWKKQHNLFEEGFRLLREFPCPVIVAINGYALGGGLEMALSCDIRIAAEHAKLGLPEAKIGIMPGVGGTQMLPRLIPVGLAKEMLFRGNQITAQRGKEIGLLNDVAEKAQLEEVTLQLAREIGENAPISLRAIKKSVNVGLQTDINTALTIELDQYYKSADSEDRLEGIRAFNEKRKPNWQGK